jgi:hypothetical protein
MDAASLKQTTNSSLTRTNARCMRTYPHMLRALFVTVAIVLSVVPPSAFAGL